MKRRLNLTVLFFIMCIAVTGCLFDKDDDDDDEIKSEEIITWSAVSAGSEHTLALRSDGTLWAWGNNQYGQLGLATFATKLAPVQVGFDADWVQASAGDYHSTGIKTGAPLMAWGLNM
ncbi:MAG TPA: hypothetical protein PLA18_09210, partial [Deltaproteobacteria bacterium]|nr:hypothetical protein [Deltaproteobacteria bacterium]